MQDPEEGFCKHSLPTYLLSVFSSSIWILRRGWCLLSSLEFPLLFTLWFLASPSAHSLAARSSPFHVGVHFTCWNARSSTASDYFMFFLLIQGCNWKMTCFPMIPRSRYLICLKLMHLAILSGTHTVYRITLAPLLWLWFTWWTTFHQTYNFVCCILVFIVFEFFKVFSVNSLAHSYRTVCIGGMAVSYTMLTLPRHRTCTIIFPKLSCDTGFCYFWNF